MRPQDWVMQHKIAVVSAGIALTSIVIYNSVATQSLYDKEEFPFFPGAFTSGYKEPKTEYFISDPRGLTNLQEITYKNIVGASTSLKCYKKALGLNHDGCYNCLGWAAWKKDWLQLPRVKYSGKEDLVRAVKDFIDVQSYDINKEFSLASGLFPAFQEADCSNPQHNMIAFYFKCIDGDNYQGCRWVHAARYLGEFNFNKEDREANLWTSKDGKHYLLSHEELSDIANLYGETTICLTPENNI